MPLDDLDLEFEDDDENERDPLRTDEILNSADDIEFSTPNVSPRTVRIPLNGAKRFYENMIKEEYHKKSLKEENIPQSDDKNEAQKSIKVDGHKKLEESSENEYHSNRERPNKVGSALENSKNSENVETKLHEKLMQVQIESKAAIEFAEFKAKFLSDLYGDLKIVRYQLEQFLSLLEEDSFENSSSGSTESAAVDSNAKNSQIKELAHDSQADRQNPQVDGQNQGHTIPKAQYLKEVEKLKNVISEFLDTHKNRSH